MAVAKMAIHVGGGSAVAQAMEAFFDGMPAGVVCVLGRGGAPDGRPCLSTKQICPCARRLNCASRHVVVSFGDTCYHPLSDKSASMVILPRRMPSACKRYAVRPEGPSIERWR